MRLNHRDRTFEFECVVTERLKAKHVKAEHVNTESTVIKNIVVNVAR
jgi:hypothetical protein